MSSSAPPTSCEFCSADVPAEHSVCGLCFASYCHAGCFRADELEHRRTRCSAAGPEFASCWRAAQGGSVAARLELGRRYKVGAGIRQDEQKAIAWFLRAHAGGSAAPPGSAELHAVGAEARHELEAMGVDIIDPHSGWHSPDVSRGAVCSACFTQFATSDNVSCQKCGWLSCERCHIALSHCSDCRGLFCGPCLSGGYCDDCDD